MSEVPTIRSRGFGSGLPNDPDATCSRSAKNSQHNDDPPGPHWVFHKLVSTSDVWERYTLGNFEPRPSCL